MKKKFLSLVLTLCSIMPCIFMLSACTKETPSNPPTVYTVTESEWETNFNITKHQPKVQTLSSYAISNSIQLLSDNSSTSLAEITSYTLQGEGVVTDGDNEIIGLGILKVAPNALHMEFYLDGVLSEDETGTFTNSNPIYIGITTMLNSFFPFSGKYNNFTFDQVKNAYIAENLICTLVNEEDINDTYDNYYKKAEITFINGYLNSIYIEVCNGDEFTDDYNSILFTFSNINNTTVDTSTGDVDKKTEL